MTNSREALELIEERARARSIDFEVIQREEMDEFDLPYVDTEIHLKIPNGRSKRIVRVTLQNARQFLDLDFEDWVFLGKYATLYNRKTGEIEAAITDGRSIFETGRTSVRSVVHRAHEAWAATRGNDRSESASEMQSSDEEALRFVNPINPRKVSAVISQASSGLRIAAIGSFARIRDYSLKIRFHKSARHDDALSFLQSYAASAFFDLDVKFGCTAKLVIEGHEDLQLLGDDPSQFGKPIYAPRNSYQSEPLELYMYGRLARSMPLLEYLSYYQCLEYYFSQFVHREVVRRIRQRLRNPDFNLDNDGDVTGLVSMATNLSPGRISEEEQLALVIANCTEPEEILDFIQATKERESFLGNPQGISGAGAIAVKDANFPLHKQLAARIYAIRCRIVHSKEGGGPRTTELLLPNSEEARRLNHDIDLVCHLAQKVLMANASTASWIRDTGDE